MAERIGPRPTAGESATQTSLKPLAPYPWVSLKPLAPYPPPYPYLAGMIEQIEAEGRAERESRRIDSIAELV